MRSAADLTGGRFTFNLDNNRPHAIVVREVLTLLDREDPDWGTLVEAGGYVKALRKPLRRAGYRLFTGRGSFSRRDSAVVVRKGIPVRGKRVHSLGGVKWERGNGRPGLHDARHMVSVVVGPRGSRGRVGAVHMPPGPASWRLRGKAWKVAMQRLDRIASRWDDARLIGWELIGDWNRVPGDPAIRKFVTDHDAYLTGSGVDYAIGTEDLEGGRKVDLGAGDHKPRTFKRKRSHEVPQAPR